MTTDVRVSPNFSPKLTHPNNWFTPSFHYSSRATLRGNPSNSRALVSRDISQMRENA